MALRDRLHIKLTFLFKRKVWVFQNAFNFVFSFVRLRNFAEVEKVSLNGENQHVQKYHDSFNSRMDAFKQLIGHLKLAMSNKMRSPSPVCLAPKKSQSDQGQKKRNNIQDRKKSF